MMTTDKAVSTEDLCSTSLPAQRNASLEAARLEAILKTLVENKVETLKNNAKRKTSSPQHLFNKLRGTNSTSTLSSSNAITMGARSRRKTCPSTPRHQGHLHFSDADDLLSKDNATAAAEIKIHIDEDFISLNIDDYEDGAERRVAHHLKKKRRRRMRRHHHRSGRKAAVSVVAVPVVDDIKELSDDDELSQRARVTIVFTAFVLLVMCLLLVGITLRMAPLIDDMVRKENEEFMNSLSHGSSSANSLQNLTAAVPVDLK